MKNLKMFISAFVMVLLSIITGCSDQIASSGDPVSPKENEAVNVQSADHGLPVVPTYKFQIILKGNSRFNLDKLSTGLDELYSIDITNSAAGNIKQNSDCYELLIYNINADMFLDCHSHGFDFGSLVIENTGSTYKKLDVLVSGIKFTK